MEIAITPVSTGEEYLQNSLSYGLVDPRPFIDYAAYIRDLIAFQIRYARNKLGEYYDNPFVMVGIESDGNVTYNTYQVHSRWELYQAIFGQVLNDPFSKIVYLNILGHGMDGYLFIGSEDDWEAVTGQMETDPEDSMLLTREHNELMDWMGLDPEDFSFEDLVKDTFAPDATIELTFCYSATGGTDSVGYAFKTLLPDAKVYGATGKLYPIPYTTTVIVPWPFTKWVEIKLE